MASFLVERRPAHEKSSRIPQESQRSNRSQENDNAKSPADFLDGVANSSLNRPAYAIPVLWQSLYSVWAKRVLLAEAHRDVASLCAEREKRRNRPFGGHECGWVIYRGAAIVPEISINYYAVLACVAAAMPLGYAWFGSDFRRGVGEAYGLSLFGLILSYWR